MADADTKQIYKHFADKRLKLNEQIDDLVQEKPILEAFCEKIGDPGLLEEVLKSLEKLGSLYDGIMKEYASEDMIGFPGQEYSKEQFASANIKSLISLADELDQAGLTKEAEDIDELLKKSVDISQVEQLEGEDVNLEGLFADYVGNPTKEKLLPLENALRDLAEKKEMTDEETAAQIQRQDEQIGAPGGGWPDNPDYKLESKRIFDGLAKVADKLDEMGAKEAADKIDEFMGKHGEDFLDYKGEDESGEQSKRYDSKHHHALQIREPKKDQERVDREGTKNHHIHTQQQTNASALNTRYCPDHVGVSVGRIGENTYQCPLDGQVYNYETGWTDYDGNQHPGGSVAAQTPDSSGYATPHRIFDTRENITNSVK